MMTDKERSDQYGVLHVDGANKLDHFILGASIAVCAYLGQTNPYARIGLNKETFLLMGLLLFGASAVYGFKRLEGRTALNLTSSRALAAQSAALREQFFEIGQTQIEKMQKCYKYRNRLLIAGALVYLTTKVAATYFCQGCMPRLP